MLHHGMAAGTATDLEAFVALLAFIFVDASEVKQIDRFHIIFICLENKRMLAKW
jgi:hypothetical protein